MTPHDMAIARAVARLSAATAEYNLKLDAFNTARVNVLRAHDALEDARRGVPAPTRLDGAEWDAWAAAGEKSRTAGKYR